MSRTPWLIASCVAPFAIALIAHARAVAPARRGRRPAVFTFSQQATWLAVTGVAAWGIAVFPVLQASAPPSAAFGLALLGPPLLMWCAMSLLVHDVARRAGLTDWTWREAVGEALSVVAGALAPTALLLTAMDEVRAMRLREATVLTIAGVAFGALMIARQHRRAGLTPHAVTSGELRDRVFDLARRAGVKLQQLYVVPFRRFRMANAFAMQGEVVILTDLLLRQLDRDEVDAVLAHEMAHLARRDPQHLGTALVAVIAVPTMLAVWFGVTIGVIALAPCLLALRVHQRRIEYATDARALTLGVRAETLITGLARLHHLSQVPVRWSPAWGLFMTHPSLEWRAQRLARVAGLDAAQVSGWLEAPPPAGALHRIPSSLDAPRAFGTAFRQGAIARLSWSLLAIAAVVPALIVAGLGAFEFVPRAVGIVFAALAGGAAWILCWALATSASMRGLERTIGTRLGPRFKGGLRAFVGLAPDGTPRVYEGFAAWDAGFLTLVDGRLDYEGEEATFSLTPRQVRSIEVDEGLPGWVRVTAVRIDWTSEDDTSGTLRLVPLGGTSAFGVGARARRLCAQLEEWREDSLHAPPRGLLGAPPSHEVTSASPRAALTPRAILTTLIVLGVLSLASAFLIGLPIHPFARGWFDASSASALAFVLVILPVLRWREPAPREQNADTERRAA